MTSRTAPSFERRATALTIAALAAVVEMSAASLGSEMLTRLAWTEYGIGPILWLLPLYLIFGTIIAIPLCLTTGLPLWYLAERIARDSRSDAMRFGLAAGAIFGCLVSFLSTNGTRASATIETLPMLLLFCVAGISTGWIAHRLGYPRP